MQITVDELVENLKKYLDMVEDGNIYIPKKGNIVAKLTKATSVKKGSLSKLFGILLKDADFERSREERYGRI